MLDPEEVHLKEHLNLTKTQIKEFIFCHFQNYDYNQLYFHTIVVESYQHFNFCSDI